MRSVHREATERVGANRLGRDKQWKGGLAYRRTEEMALCLTGHVRNMILFIGRGLAYRKMEETDLCWTSYSRNGVLLIGRVWRTAKRTKQTSYGRNRDPVDREGCGVSQNG